MPFIVTCPECALESVSEVFIAAIASSLLTGKAIRLYAACHDMYWTATRLEREQLREFLRAIHMDASQYRAATDSAPSRSP